MLKKYKIGGLPMIQHYSKRSLVLLALGSVGLTGAHIPPCFANDQQAGPDALFTPSEQTVTETKIPAPADGPPSEVLTKNLEQEAETETFDNEVGDTESGDTESGQEITLGQGIPSCQQLQNGTLSASGDGRANEVCEKARVVCFVDLSAHHLLKSPSFKSFPRKKRLRIERAAKVSRQKSKNWREWCGIAREVVGAADGADFVQSLVEITPQPTQVKK
jgi:hypothetical protein